MSWQVKSLLDFYT